MRNLLNEFRDAVALARRLIAAVHTVDTTGAYTWVESDRSLVVEAAFLKVFIAWETLQERVFTEYLMGTLSAAGKTVARYAQPTDKEHANRMILGMMRYVDWSTPDPIRKLANNFFANGQPFERVLASIHSDLTDLKTIRNAAAHLSTTTAKPLDALASRKLQRSVSGISTASLLLSPDPMSATGSTIFDTYVDILDAAAEGIVEG